MIHGYAKAGQVQQMESTYERMQLLHQQHLQQTAQPAITSSSSSSTTNSSSVSSASSSPFAPDHATFSSLLLGFAHPAVADLTRITHYYHHFTQPPLSLPPNTHIFSIVMQCAAATNGLPAVIECYDTIVSQRSEADRRQLEEWRRRTKEGEEKEEETKAVVQSPQSLPLINDVILTVLLSAVARLMKSQSARRALLESVEATVTDEGLMTLQQEQQLMEQSKSLWAMLREHRSRQHARRSAPQRNRKTSDTLDGKTLKALAEFVDAVRPFVHHE